MTQSNDKGNQGVIMTGGTLSADNLAIGKNASIVNESQDQKHTGSALQELATELSQLIELMKKHQLDERQIEAAKLAKSELESESPNIFLAKSILVSVIDAAKTINSVSGSILSIKKLLDVLMP